MSDLVGNTNCWFSHAKAQIDTSAAMLVVSYKVPLSRLWNIIFHKNYLLLKYSDIIMQLLSA